MTSAGAMPHLSPPYCPPICPRFSPTNPEAPSYIFGEIQAEKWEETRSSQPTPSKHEPTHREAE